MRVSVSNIAWDAASDEFVADMLRRHDIDAIDVAPSRYFREPGHVSPSRAEPVRRFWEDRGVSIVGMQSLLFGTSGLNLFGPPSVQTDMLGHLKKVFAIASALGASRLTFGSPRNRDRTGLDDDQATLVACEFFRRVGDAASEYGITFCLEPNAVRYGSNFMLDSVSTSMIVVQTAHPNIKMQLDTGALALADEHAEEMLSHYAPLIGHIHASEPDLVPVGTGGVDHDGSSTAVRTHLPDHVVTIEMAQVLDDPDYLMLERSVAFVLERYAR